MIPLRDTNQAEGTVWITLAAIVGAVVLAVTGQVAHMNALQLLLAIWALWLFAPFVERQLGHLLFALLFLILFFLAGFLTGAVDHDAGNFAPGLFLPVLGIGLVHLALAPLAKPSETETAPAEAPRSGIIGLIPIPFAMTFVTVPAALVLVAWVVLEIALTAL